MSRAMIFSNSWLRAWYKRKVKWLAIGKVPQKHIFLIWISFNIFYFFFHFCSIISQTWGISICFLWVNSWYINKYDKLQILERTPLLSKGSNCVLDLPDWSVWLWASFARESCDRYLRWSELRRLSFLSLVVQQPLDREEHGLQWGLLF